jgi:hypothetical protein
MTDTHISLRVSEALNEALEELAHASRTSKSQVIRDLLGEKVEEDGLEVPDHLRREMRREKLKQRNRLRWQRIHFPSNVADRFRRAFEQGDLGGDLNPGAVEELRDIHIEDARLLFEEDEERQEATVEFVNALADHAAEASDASEFDRLDPKEMFERYAGVEEGRGREEAADRMEDLVADAESRLRGGYDDLDALADALTNIHDVPPEMAEEAVRQAEGAL